MGMANPVATFRLHGRPRAREADRAFGCVPCCAERPGYLIPGRCTLVHFRRRVRFFYPQVEWPCCAVAADYGVVGDAGRMAEMSCPQADSARVPSGTETAWAIACSVLTVEDLRPCSMSTIIRRETPDRAASPSRVRPAACLAAATARPSETASYGKGSFAGSSSRSRKKLLHTTGARCCLHRHRTGCRIWRVCARRSGARRSHVIE